MTMFITKALNPKRDTILRNAAHLRDASADFREIRQTILRYRAKCGIVWKA